MKGYVTNIEQQTLENINFRKVLYTAEHSQLVLMSLKPGEDIGAETHELDQFIRIEEGSGHTDLAGEEYSITAGSAIVVPAGTRHNIVNTGATEMKLYTLYSPPNHRDGIVHATKEDAERDEKNDADHFDGKTTERSA